MMKTKIKDYKFVKGVNAKGKSYKEVTTAVVRGNDKTALTLALS